MFILILIGGFIFLPGIAKATTETFPLWGPGGLGTWTAPIGVTSVIVEVWAGGGQGGGSSDNNGGVGGGGAGGGFASKTVAVIPCTPYSYYVGKPGYFGTATTNGSAGEDSWFIDTATVLAKGGEGGRVGPNGVGGATTTGAIGTVIYHGGNGAAGVAWSNGAGGGGGAGSAGNGTAGVGVTKGIGGTPDGGDGGQITGSGDAHSPGGGGYGSKYASQGWHGGYGGRGQVRLTYTAVTTTKTITTFGAGAWTAPTGVTCVLAETWAGGGGGGSPGLGGDGGGGGAGGGFASAIVTVVPGAPYDYYVGRGGWWIGTAGQDSMFQASSTVLSKGGGQGGSGPSGAGGTAGTEAVGTTIFNGGDGAAGVNANYSGGGGGGAGSTGDGTTAVTYTAGSGGSLDGGAGGAGRTTTGSGNAGSAPGGGGGGGKKVDNEGWFLVGGFGAPGQIRLTYALPTSWAWNSNIGWISFDSANCDSNGNGFIDTDAIVPGCGGNDDATTPIFEYGISVDPATGNFSGYAWSNSVGWISFNRSDTGDPPGEPYQSGTILAHYNKGNNQVEGWAKILTFKDICVGGANPDTLCPNKNECTGGGSCQSNGWIKFNGNKQDGQPWEPGVTINPATGDFSGWAWNANDDGSGIGWISFNCSNESPPCDKSNYKVIININSINSSPTAVDLTAPNWGYAQARDKALYANLKFGFVDTDAGSYGSAYKIIVTKADNTPVLDTDKCTGYNTPSAKCKFDNSICMKKEPTGCINPGDCVCQYPLEAELEYGTAYKWSVQVWDNFDVASATTTYDTDPDFPLEADDGVVQTFTTYKHKFPLVSAIYFPLEPSRGEKVKFTDTSKRYFTFDPETPIACTSDTCVWKWILPPSADATIDDDATSTPTITFNSISGNSVTLRVTDKTDTGTIPYYSEKIINVNVNAKLPKWREVKPE